MFTGSGFAHLKNKLANDQALNKFVINELLKIKLFINTTV